LTGLSIYVVCCHQRTTHVQDAITVDLPSNNRISLSTKNISPQHNNYDFYSIVEHLQFT